MIMKKLLLIILLFSFGSVSIAQDIAFDKANFPNDKEGFKIARDHLKTGDDIYEEGNKFRYNLSIPHYEKAYSFNPNNAALNFKLGVAYLNSPRKQKSLQYFQKSFELNPDYDPYNIHFLLARGYHLNEKWEEAIAEYQKQIAVLQKMGGEPDEFKVIQRFLEEVKNGKDLIANPERVWVDNLGSEINSKSPEYAPLISTDESIIIITARRENGVGGLKDENDEMPFEDIYISRNNAGTWGPLQNMGEEINTSGHDASSGLSHDGKTLFVFKGTANSGGDIYVSRLVEGDWTKPKDLGKNINSKFHESSASLSYDSKKLYFISDREGGIGGRDIYVSDWNSTEGEWGSAQNLGPAVNSAYDEDGVYIHPDSKTLYFSSKGHNSMGGNDIFYAVNTNGAWSKPTNIGYPINSPDDDVFFIMAADGRTAYYSSIREEGFGEKDIYRITFLGPEKEPMLSVEDNLIAGSGDAVMEIILQPAVEIKTSNLILLKGRILDEKTSLPVGASIDLIDNETSGVVASFSNDAESGAYLVSLPAGRNYGLNISAPNYLFHSENFNIPDTAHYKQYNLDIRLQKIEIGSTVVLKNIFFDYNKFTLRKESESEINRLTELLSKNPQIKVEISGHTDNVGGDEYNQKLSENRAKSVVESLVSNGIATERLIYKGYGKLEPVATNETPEGRQENRRTEFKIIE